ncbi:MAG: 4-hydroxy-tetrahydrodipicolinate reductase, partial [Fimbriimonadaceae bacterium]
MADSEGMIKVVVTGAAGRMGIEVVKTVSQADDMKLVGAVDRTKVGSSAREVAGPEADDLEISSKLGEILDRETPDVLVDFTNASAAPANAMSCLERNIAVVVGASGLGNQDQRSMGETAREKGTPCLLVPNFAIGAVLMMRFSEMAAKWMKDVSIVELHHDKKIDAPSGTASATAHLIANAKGDNYVKRSPKEQINVEGARGGFLNGV